jgi:hypothetical protein
VASIDQLKVSSALTPEAEQTTSDPLPALAGSEKSNRGHSWEIAIGFVLLALVLAFLAVRSGLGTSRFSYTLDDPLIHLRLAEQIARGHYGINSSEFSSPSSSILWPFLLATVARWEFSLYAPLFLNVGFAFALAAVALRAFRGDFAVPKVILLLICTNAVGLVFTGMEHSLQVLLSVLCAWGMVVEARENRVPMWFLAALVLGPLIRYENFTITAPICAYLLFKGWRREPIITFALVAAITIGFSLFLHSLGLGMLPNSVVAKSGEMSFNPRQVFVWVPHGNIRDHRVIVQFQAALVLCIFFGYGRARAFGWVAFASLILHLIVGKYGWYDRYECYLNGFLLALTLQSTTQILRWPVQNRIFSGAVALAAILTVVPALRYLNRAKQVPVDARDIAIQQLQMHRFAVDDWKQPIAVNDLGWVSWRNDSYVLDLWGLASSEAIKRRLISPDGEWMDDLCRRHQVRLCMIYQNWFPKLPTGWFRVATLHRPPTDDRATVAIFATDPAAVPLVQSLLTRFKPQLPRDAWLVLDSPPIPSAKL